MLRLRPLRPDDEVAFRAAHETMLKEGFNFALFEFSGQMSWDRYLTIQRDHQTGKNLPSRFVPSTFLVAEVSGRLVGRVSIRHRLNSFLAHAGGHIGYGVLPDYRRRGYATEILRQSLIIARSLGIGRVLVTCDEDNIGSSRAIEACGGILDSLVTVEANAPKMRRYWID